MIHQDLFHHILIAPASELRGGRLRIVSGFATAQMASRHMRHLKELELNISIDLIIGMIIHPDHGIQEEKYFGFCKLMEQAPASWGIDFQCRYVTQGNPVHAKSYVWLDHRGRPVKAFCGSSNYTLQGFGMQESGCAQVEIMTLTDPDKANGFHDHILRFSERILPPDSRWILPNTISEWSRNASNAQYSVSEENKDLPF